MKKTPLTLISFGCILGMDIRESKASITTVPEMLIYKNQKSFARR